MNDGKKHILFQTSYHLGILFDGNDGKFIIEELNQLKGVIDKTIGITINLNNKNLFDTNNYNIHYHAQCFFTCGGKQYFYDDNGIDSSNDLKPDEYYKADDVRKLNDLNSSQEDDELKNYGNTVKTDISKTFVEFDWISYLKNTIDDIINIIEKNMELDSDKKNDFGKLYTKFSKLYYGHKEQNTLGKKYLKYI